MEVTLSYRVDVDHDRGGDFYSLVLRYICTGQGETFKMFVSTDSSYEDEDGLEEEGQLVRDDKEVKKFLRMVGLDSDDEIIGYTPHVRFRLGPSSYFRSAFCSVHKIFT